MTRNNAREIAVHLVFSMEFGSRRGDEVLESELNRERFAALSQETPLYTQYPNEKQREYIQALVHGIDEHGEELDGYISRYAVGWSLHRIPRMARAILRTALYELLYMPDVPNASAIDAAVELTKKYEPQEVAAFVNGILGTFARTELPDQGGQPEETSQDSEEGSEDTAGSAGGTDSEAYAAREAPSGEEA